MVESISIVAGGIKKPGIALADACIGATAQVHGLSVLSGDKHFDQMNIQRIGYPWNSGQRSMVAHHGDLRLNTIEGLIDVKAAAFSIQENPDITLMIKVSLVF